MARMVGRMQFRYKFEMFFDTCSDCILDHTAVIAAPSIRRAKSNTQYRSARALSENVNCTKISTNTKLNLYLMGPFSVCLTIHTCKTDCHSINVHTLNMVACVCAFCLDIFIAPNTVCAQLSSASSV